MADKLNSMHVPQAWLEAFNERMALNGTPHAARPLRAWMEWCRKSGESFDMSHPEAQAIAAWFESRSPAGALNVPAVFTGVFYYDAYFWPVHIPLTYGAAMLDGRAALFAMPQPTMDRLFHDCESCENFKALWADCLDYGQGFSDLNLAGRASAFWEKLIVSGNHKLRSAVEDLTRPLPGPNAMQSSREACEMFLKSLLARDHSLLEKDAIGKFGHSLSKLLSEVLQVRPTPLLREIEARLSVFPKVEDRYAGKTYKSHEMWGAYKLSQAAAAEVLRLIIGRNNVRAQIATRF